MTKRVYELFQEINDKPELAPALLAKHKALGMILKHAFDPAWKFELPPGCPPYKQLNLPEGTFENTLHHEARRLHIFMRRDVKPARLEQIYIQMLETLLPKAVEVINAVKDQTLTTAYPNITGEKVAEWGIIERPVKAPAPAVPPTKKPKSIKRVASTLKRKRDAHGHFIKS